MKSGGVANEYLQTTMISVYSNLNQFKGALDMFSQISSPNTISFNAVLGSCMKVGADKTAWDLYSKMVNLKVPLDGITIQILQNIFDKKHSQREWMLISTNQLHSGSVDLTLQFLVVATFTIGINCFAVTNGRGWTQRFSFGTQIVNSSLDKELADKALKLTTDVQTQSSYSPSYHAVHYHAERKAIACLLSAQSDDTLTVHVNMSICDDCHWFCECLAKLYPSKTFTVIAGNTTHIFRDGTCSCGCSFASMRHQDSANCKKLLASQTKYLQRLIGCGDWSKAQELWKQISLAKPDIVTFSVMTQWFVKNPTLTEGEKLHGLWTLINQMVSCSVSPDYGIWAVLLQVYIKFSKARQTEQTKFLFGGILKIWEELLHSSEIKQCNITILNMLIVLLGRYNFEQMWEVYKYIESNKLVPTIVTFNSLLQHQQTLDGCDKVMQELRKHNLTPNAVTYNILIAHYSM
jgi:hypothetical protein